LKIPCPLVDPTTNDPIVSGGCVTWVEGGEDTDDNEQSQVVCYNAMAE